MLNRTVLSPLAPRTRRLLLTSAALLAAGYAWQGGRAQSPAVANPSAVDFTRDIQPIFAKSCYSCHGAKSQMGNLRLDSKKLALSGGQSGHAIVAGKSAESTLFQRVAGTSDQARMPMGGKPLSPAEIDLIKKWIDAGAVWPEDAGTEQTEIRKHWAYIAPQRPREPSTKNTQWPVNAIDRFILARLEKEGLQPSGEADKLTLLRRLSLDLIGLPPTIEEVNAFLADSSE
jgi:mono/diheme cytochrome c family protein